MTTQRLREAGLPVPEVNGVVKLNGRGGVILEHIQGRSVYDRLRSRPWECFQAAGTVADLHKRVHGRTVPGLPSQRERLRKGILAADGLSREALSLALLMLDQLPDGESVCHGDFHLNNILLSPHGMIVIDWDHAAKGHPLGDVAQSLLLFRLERLWSGNLEKWAIRSAQWLFRRLYLKHYLRGQATADRQVFDWAYPVVVARLGERIPSEREQLLTLANRLFSKFRN